MTSLLPTEFTDLQGTTWDTRITLASAKRIDSVDYSALTDKKFSLLRPDENLQGFFGELMTNVGLLFAILFDNMWSQVCKNLNTDPNIHRPQAELEFSERMGGEQIISARKAFWSALQDFFPQHKIALQKSLNGYESSMKIIQEELDGLEPQVLELIQEKARMDIKNLREQLLSEIRGPTS